MLNIAENLLNISKSLNRDEFDTVKKTFKKLMGDVTNLQLEDSEFELQKNIFKIRTLGAKKVRISMFLDDIQERMKGDLVLFNFILRL